MTMFHSVQNGRAVQIDDTVYWDDPLLLEAPNAYRRLIAHIIVTIVLATLVIAEAGLFIGPVAPHTNPA
jgi:hypothetical protein